MHGAVPGTGGGVSNYNHSSCPQGDTQSSAHNPVEGGQTIKQETYKIQNDWHSNGESFERSPQLSPRELQKDS